VPTCHDQMYSSSSYEHHTPPRLQTNRWLCEAWWRALGLIWPRGRSDQWAVEPDVTTRAGSEVARSPLFRGERFWDIFKNYRESRSHRSSGGATKPSIIYWIAINLFVWTCEKHPFLAREDVRFLIYGCTENNFPLPSCMVVLTSKKSLIRFVEKRVNIYDTKLISSDTPWKYFHNVFIQCHKYCYFFYKLGWT
jgi:hypothetical protein